MRCLDYIPARHDIRVEIGTGRGARSLGNERSHALLRILGEFGYGPAAGSRNYDHAIQVRSTNVVSMRHSWKAAWERISRCSGVVVRMPSTRSSFKARDMQSIASRRVGWWTISLPIIES